MGTHIWSGRIGVKVKPGKQPDFHDGKLGAAFAVRLRTHAKRNQVKKVDREGTVFIDLADDDSIEINVRLRLFLGKFLGVKPEQIEIMNSAQTEARLVMVLGVKPEDIDLRIKAKKP